MSADLQIQRHGDANTYPFWIDAVSDALTAIEILNDTPNNLHLHSLRAYNDNAAIQYWTAYRYSTPGSTTVVISGHATGNGTATLITSGTAAVFSVGTFDPNASASGISIKAWTTSTPTITTLAIGTGSIDPATGLITGGTATTGAALTTSAEKVFDRLYSPIKLPDDLPVFNFPAKAIIIKPNGSLFLIPSTAAANNRLWGTLCSA